MSEKVTLFEVGPRDGLQNEEQLISTSHKVQLINLLSQCGFNKIEATSFVSPKWVPQLADARDVMDAINRKHGVSYAVLTPNLIGYERARDAGADEVAVFASASETFSQKNINCSIDESIARFMPLMTAAKNDGIPVRGYVSCVIECPYEGAILPTDVAKVAGALIELGCYQISLGDTIGRGNRANVSAMLDEMLRDIRADKLAGHFHDTDRNAIENISVSLDKGLRVFDSAIGGLGGCPYAPGAKGNVATGAVVEFLDQQGFATEIDIDALKSAEQFLKQMMQDAA